MKRLSFLMACLFLSSLSFGQILKKGENSSPKAKKKKFNLMEKIGDVTGNLLTGKTETLDNVVVKASYISGLYSPEIKTTEAKYFKPGAKEGDYMLYITFFKNEGAGLLELMGEVTTEGEPMEYYGMGTYGKHYDAIPDGPVTIDIKTNLGDEASFTFEAVQDVEILSVNGEKALPVLDLDEDIELEYYNPPGSEGTTIKVSMLTKVMGVRAFNHFADFKVTKSGNVKVTIPKEALSNPEIAGQLNMGNYDKGENYIILERETLKKREDFGGEQKPGKVSAVELVSRNYASFPVIVKGKQDEGIMTVLRVRGETEDKSLGYAFYKPNATTGIPISKASKFGLVSFTMEAKTYKRESETSSSSWTLGNTKYTQTTTTTTTYEFPELPEDYWDNALDKAYQEIVNFFKSEYGIDFVPVENVTATAQYNDLFAATNDVSSKRVLKSYKNTKRYTPSSIGEILGSISSNVTTDNPTVNMMKTAGEVDGLVSIHIDLTVGGNKEGKVVLYPTMQISVAGRDETRQDKQGKYFDGQITRKTGEPFNGDHLKANKAALVDAISLPYLLGAMKEGITTLRAKEVEMGYDAIWGITEE